jgi:dihydroflavonol-4-reductase
MKVLLSGADGFLGSHIAAALHAKGHDIRALIQPGRNTRVIDELPVERFIGDLTERRDIAEAVKGCDALINTAASTSVWPSRAKEIWKINYAAVRLLADAALAEKLKVFVHIGTANSFGPGSKEEPGSEENPFRDGKYGLDYIDSKRGAQELLLRYHKEEGLPVKIINPSFMLGPKDTKPGSGQMIISVAEGRVPGYTAGGKNYIHVRDVADAAVSALENGETGQCYLAANRNMSYREAFECIAETVGCRAPKLPIPPSAAVCIGAIGSCVGRITGKAPMLSLPMARLANASCYYSGEKARRELGMPRRSIEDAVREAYQWFLENNYLKGDSE